MPSEIGRGFKFGLGFALGVGFVMVLFLGGLSMCAGHLHRRMLDKFQQQTPDKERPPEEVPDSLLSRACPGFAFPPRFTYSVPQLPAPSH